MTRISDAITGSPGPPIDLTTIELLEPSEEYLAIVKARQNFLHAIVSLFGIPARSLRLASPLGTEETDDDHR